MEGEGARPGEQTHRGAGVGNKPMMAALGDQRKERKQQHNATDTRQNFLGSPREGSEVWVLATRFGDLQSLDFLNFTQC